MKKSNNIDMNEVIETAYQIKHEGKRSSDTTKWNKICREVGQDSPDGAAFSECGSFDYNINEVKEELEEKPTSLFYQSLLKIMEQEKVKEVTLIND